MRQAPGGGASSLGKRKEQKLCSNKVLMIILILVIFFLVGFTLVHFKSDTDDHDLNLDNNNNNAERLKILKQKKQEVVGLREEVEGRQLEISRKEKELNNRELELNMKEKKAYNNIVAYIDKLAKNVKLDVPVKKAAKLLGRDKGAALPALAAPANVGEAKYCIVTAYRGDIFETIDVITTLTKEKYSELHGYHYIEEKSFANSKSMSWAEVKFATIKKHLPNYDYVWWTEPDLVIVNPSIMLETLTNDGLGEPDVVMSKDWGGRQVNPGTFIIKNSPNGKRFLEQWEEYMKKAGSLNDELRAVQTLIDEKKADVELNIKWVSQSSIGSYPHFGPRDGQYAFILKQENGHELYHTGDFAVHVVDCVRDAAHKDPICCSGIAAQYMLEFEKNYRKHVQNLRNKGAKLRRTEEDGL